MSLHILKAYFASNSFIHDVNVYFLLYSVKMVLQLYLIRLFKLVTFSDFVSIKEHASSCSCLLSSTYSSSDSEKEQQVTSFLRARVMSRRSLRLDEGLLDRSLPRGSASFSAGGGDWRSSRSVWTSAEGAFCSGLLLLHLLPPFAGR